MSLDIEDDMRAAEYALGLLPAEERLAFEQEMRVRPELKAAMWRWQEMLSGLNCLIKPAMPSATLWPRIDSTVSKMRPYRKSRNITGWAGWAGWAIAAVLAGVMIIRPITAPVSSNPVAILNSTDGYSQFVVSTTADRHVITVSGLNVPMESNHSLQLWLLEGDAAPVSLGLLEKTTNILNVNTIQLNKQSQLAVSLEPKGGAPGLLPTGPILYKGTVVQGSVGI